MIAPVGALSRFVATFLLGATLALATNVLSAALDGLGVRHALRVATDVILGAVLIGAGLLALEFINHLSVRYYVLLALTAGAGLYAALAAPAVGPAVKAVTSWPGRMVRSMGSWGGRRSHT